ncbi:MAG: hypothetical protein HY951_13865 [Bacteroidia bacterium]|nr:hypothetical protein [Bacteroidia bacterium]
MKKTLLILFSLTLFAISLIAKENELKFSSKNDLNYGTWEVHIFLDSTLIEPEAIQICMVNFDPYLKFKNTFFTTYYIDRLKQAKNEKDKTVIVFSHIEVTWENFFESVRGSDMLLLMRKKGQILSYYSDSQIPKTKKWIISSIFYIKDKPYSFAIPIEVGDGTKLEIELNSSNMTLLTDLCEL